MRTAIKQRLVIAQIAGVAVFVLMTGICLGESLIRLGVAGVHSGELASYGISSLRGVEIAVRDINAGGGILGREVQLLVEDDQCRPKEASIKASKLAARHVHAVIGHTCSGATKAALEIYNSSKILVMSPSATNPALTQSGEYPNFFRTIAPDNAQAKVQVDFALAVLKLKRIAVLHDKGVYGKGLAEFVRDAVEKSAQMELVLYEGIPPATIDFTSIVQKIKRSKAGAVIFGGYHPGAAQLVIHMRKRKMNTVFISGDGVKDGSFIVSAGKYAEGVYATAPKDTLNRPLGLAAFKAYATIYGADPGPFFFNAYAAVLALSNAFEKAGSTEYEAVSRALRKEYVDTPIGKITFDEHGDAVGTGFSVYRVKDGVFVELN